MKRYRKFAALAVSAAILGAIFYKVEPDRIFAQFIGIDWGWFGLSMVVFIPQFLIRMVRLSYLMEGQINYRDSLRAVMAASALNALIPSKGGDIAKGFFVKRHVEATYKTTFSALIFERAIDVGALLVILIAGLATITDGRPLFLGVWVAVLLMAGAVVLYVVAQFWSGTDRIRDFIGRWSTRAAAMVDSSRVFVSGVFRKNRFPGLAALSLILWGVHVFQFYCFFQALGYEGSWLTVAAYVPASILVGMLPITLAGIGTRDLAIIVFFAPWAPVELAVGVGLLSHLRYILPGLAGLPAAYSYMKDPGSEVDHETS